ncbi:pyridoxamine 5'-phosphate oxidase family protein [Acidothermaceae bacterium B102]|nr:pyridoxamine 5'-phosphate oxidase family protein [Acidothermaceae bacterium B102]
MQPIVVDEQAGAIGKRVAARRIGLGYSRALVASRAGMAESYLEYVESQGGHPSAGALRRLAEVLHTSVELLYGEQSIDPEAYLARDRSTLEAPAPLRTTPAVVSRLTPDECHLLMGSVPVGRVAFVVNGPPLVLPVNFTLMGSEIVIRTAAMAPLAELARASRLVSFEVDEIDEQSRLGWSVLCHGPARISPETGSTDHHAVDLVQPWIGGDRRAVVVITPTTITGRRIGLA